MPLHAASGLFMFTLPPKRGTTRKQKLIKKAEFLDQSEHFCHSLHSFVHSFIHALIHKLIYLIQAEQSKYKIGKTAVQKERERERKYRKVARIYVGIIVVSLFFVNSANAIV